MSREPETNATRRVVHRTHGGLGALVAAGMALVACSAPAPSAVTPCPTAAPSAVVSASSTASSVASTAPTSAPLSDNNKPLPGPAPERTRWADTFEDGSVLLRAHPSGLAVIPVFTGAEIEGSRLALLDVRGLPIWERRLGAIGAVSAAVLPDGAIALLVADQLDWPNTPEPYDKRRVIVVSADGKSEKSFRLPSGAVGASIQVDAKGTLVIDGSHTAPLTFAKGLVLGASKDGERGFVAGFDRDGKALWARELQEGGFARVVHPDKLLVTSDPSIDAAQSVALLDDQGKDVFRLAIPRECRIRDLAPSGATLGVITAPDCFGVNAPGDAYGTCYYHRLDPSNGRVLLSVKLPDCTAAIDDAGFAAVTEDRSLVVLDAAGEERWSMAMAVPPGCLYSGFQTTSIVLGDGAIHVAGSCQGERIGTMMNSPYSRAYDRATTYLSSHDRK